MIRVLLDRSLPPRMTEIKLVDRPEILVGRRITTQKEIHDTGYQKCRSKYRCAYLRRSFSDHASVTCRVLYGKTHYRQGQQGVLGSRNASLKFHCVFLPSAFYLPPTKPHRTAEKLFLTAEARGS